MKLIFCRWKSICEQGIANAFKRIGCDVVELNREIDDVDYEQDYLKELCELIQDNPGVSCVFSINFI